ncbi:hypothetical protein MNBD_GAMMA22-2148 [hydrothermal vent metagenome]|uniref:Flagellar hook-associated protein FlgL n=1 Tax=hydrothermal vent metagenome TaxID=652676 RepID=A0A3B1AN37_9ZZZZ
MRISSNQIHQVAVNAMLDQQSKLSDTQQQVATGQRISSAADDPVAAARIVDLQQLVDNFDQFQGSINSSRNRLEVQEGVLENVVVAIQRVRELALQSNNAIQTNDTREFIAEEIKQLNQELMGLANSVDSNNDFLFSGSKVKFQPFTTTINGNFQYNGDDNRRMLQIGPNRQIASGDSGTDVFRTIRSGNGSFSINSSETNHGEAVANPGFVDKNYKPDFFVLEFKKDSKTQDMYYKINDLNGNMLIPADHNTKYREDGEIEFMGIHTSFKGEPMAGDRFVFMPSKNQDLFSTLRGLSNTLSTPRNSPDSKANMSNDINQSLVSLDQALDNILKIRSNTGSRLRALDNQHEINSSHLLHIKEIQSEIKDLDYTEAVTRLNLRLTGLEASQKAYSKVQNLSMFDYI